MSRTALIIEGRRLPRLSFRDEILMMLEASELLKIVRKRKTPIARFKGIISLLNKQDFVIMSDDLRKYFTPETVSKLRNKNFGDAASLQLRSSFDEPIQRAFTKAGLNPEDQIHSRIMMMVLCWSIFPPEYSRSRLVWTGKRYCQLLRDAHKHTSSRLQRSDRYISKKLAEFGTYSEETVREKLPEARDPEKNKVLKVYVNRGLASIRASYERRRHEWPPIDLERVEERIGQLTQLDDLSSVAEPHDVFPGPSSALQLFNKLRESGHARLVQVMRLNEIPIRTVEKFLESRRAQGYREVRNASFSIPDYNTFLYDLEHVIKDDVFQLVRNKYLDEAALSQAHAEKQQRDLARLKDALARYYCVRIAKGEIAGSLPIL
jgi:hypothetical protein